MGCRKHLIPTTTRPLSGTAMILLIMKIDMIDTLYTNHEALMSDLKGGIVMRNVKIQDLTPTLAYSKVYKRRRYEEDT